MSNNEIPKQVIPQGTKCIFWDDDGDEKWTGLYLVTTRDGCHVDYDGSCFDNAEPIKEPLLRPWKMSEVPFPCQLLIPNSNVIVTITEISQHGVCTGASQHSFIVYEQLLNKGWKYRTSHKEEWRICGVEDCK